MFVWHHHSLPVTQYFSHYLWVSYLSPSAVFFPPQYPNSSNLVKKKQNPEHEDQTSERRRRNLGEERTKQPTQEKKKRKKKKNRTANPREDRKKKKVKRWSKVAAEYYLWVPYVCLIIILSLSYELWKLKTAKMCFQFP